MSIASNGVIYGLDNQGVIPEILVNWFDERKSLRKLAKEYADKQDWDNFEFYNKKQIVQKILLNSIYGCLGLPVWRFYDKDNAAAVTLTGQDIIRTAEKSINQYYNRVIGKKYRVTYDDGTTEVISGETMELISNGVTPGRP